MRKPSTGRRASVVDVAQRAGVSVGTVSNFLNRPDQVAAATRTRVQAAIDELQFVPSAAARRMRAGTLTTVGAVVLDLTNPFFTDLALGMQDRLAQDGWTLMLAGSQQDATEEKRFLGLFEQHGLRSVAVVPTSDDIRHLVALAKRGIRVVLLDRPSPVPEISSVAVDDVNGGRLAVEHLIGLGHRKITMLNGPRSVRQCADRFAGAVAAASDAGLDPAAAIEEITVTLDPAGGETGIRRLLARPAGERPTAVFCINDLVGLGALRTLRREGVDVPGQVAVVGYDDVSYAGELVVPLTSIRQPARQIGITAAELLLRPADTHAPMQVMYQPELVVRESTDD